MSSQKPIESYSHSDKSRSNNPPVGLVTPDTDPDSNKKEYQHDPHIDPNLSWTGKIEGNSFDVDTVSLHVHERIDPISIIDSFRESDSGKGQLSFFDDDLVPLSREIEFYKHSKNWTNRLISGDSLLVMNSLLEKEGLGAKIQMIYIDPPYGIKYGSNFQPFINKKDVQDGKDSDLTGEPEMIKAFRDTWELGIHSYLSYLRDRLLVARELLKETGSVFVQIGKENVHRVAILLEEIFGVENRIATITYATTGSSSSNTLPETANYILWFGKDKTKVKFHQLYGSRDRKGILDVFKSSAQLEVPGKDDRYLNQMEKSNPKQIPIEAKMFRTMPLSSSGISQTGRSNPYIHKGIKYKCATNSHWSVSHEGLNRLFEIGRIKATKSTLELKVYEDEHPGRKINNVWAQSSSAQNKVYVVQTAQKIIERCILMSTDPGDIVLDPTCGSGTTAYVAEKWGRRWITCDTSRVALTLAKKRLMTAVFDFYKLANDEEGVGSGFQYKSVETVSAATLAYDQPRKKITLYNQPHKDSSVSRVTGPFSVEAVPSPTVKCIDEIIQKDNMIADASISRTGETSRYNQYNEILLKSGIRGEKGHNVYFSRLEPLNGTSYLHWDGELESYYIDNQIVTPPRKSQNGYKRTVVSFGPDYAPLEQRQVSLALEEASQLIPKPKFVVFVAFQFDPEAAKDIDQIKWPGVTILKAQINTDLLTQDLRKKTRDHVFWLIGQPDVTVEKISKYKPEYQVSVNGFDYYNPLSGELESGGKNKIAMWMLDPDYDGRSLLPKQVFFPIGSATDGWGKLAKTLKANINQELIENFRGTKSLPFQAGEYNRIAVKIIDDRGIESLKIVNLK